MKRGVLPTIKVSIGSAQWQWDKDFLISNESLADEGEDIEAAVNAVNRNHRWIALLVVPVSVLLIGAVAGAVYLCRKKKKEEEEMIRIIKEMLSTI